jgi:hypothetical protein
MSTVSDAAMAGTVCSAELAERIAAAIKRIERANREARQLVDVDDDGFGPPATVEDYKRDVAEELGIHDVDGEHYAGWLEYDARLREETLAGLRLDAHAAEIGDIDNPVGMERLDLDPDNRNDCAMYTGYVRRGEEAERPGCPSGRSRTCRRSQSRTQNPARRGRLRGLAALHVRLAGCARRGGGRGLRRPTRRRPRS